MRAPWEAREGRREGFVLLTEGPFHPPSLDMKLTQLSTSLWRRPKAGTQNPKRLLPLPCCVSWGRLLTLSGLVSKWRRRGGGGKLEGWRV